MVSNYGQFCPVAMAAEILCPRWTLVLLCEMMSGSTRFNEIRRGVPRMSPALLSKRLKELEVAGVINRNEGPDGMPEYFLTARGWDLHPIIQSIGGWAQKWIDSDVAMENLDVQLLMWNMRRNLDPDPMPRRRIVVQFIYGDLPPTQRNWWLIVEPGKDVDLCSIDPAHDVDLYVTADLRAMTKAWMGHSSMSAEITAGTIILTGDKELARNFDTWIGASSLACAYTENWNQEARDC
jgi:DNA-binding HxlR family transcriptional regulator